MSEPHTDSDLVRIIATELAAGGAVDLPGIGRLSHRVQPARVVGDAKGIKVSAPRPKLTFEPESESTHRAD